MGYAYFANPFLQFSFLMVVFFVVMERLSGEYAVLDTCKHILYIPLSIEGNLFQYCPWRRPRQWQRRTMVSV